MYLVDSLLAALMKEDGESLVLHVGERPAVVTARGPVEIASGPMSLDAVDRLLSDLLSPEARQTLEEFGVVETGLPPSTVAPGERFSVVAARGGDDIWIEIRRRRPGASAATLTAGPPAAPPRPAAPLPEPAVVLPLSRHPARSEPGVRPPPSRTGGLERLLRVAAARGAEALFLGAQAKPAIRVDGEISVLEGEAALAATDVETLLLDVLPARHDDPRPAEGEWICDVPDVGRVRCSTFVDSRGPGATFRMIPARALSAEQLGLSREIQALCGEPEGLVLVTGPRASGKSTLLASFVDLIGRTRAEHVITLESRVRVVHEPRRALVSQREVRGGADELLSALRAALRESPDVIVIEDLRSAEVVNEALEAAASGYFVIGGVPAHSAPEAVARLLELGPPERRPQLQAMLADTLRGVVAQVLLRKSGGGRVAAREVLLGSTSVSSLVAEGRLAQLAQALEGGRRHGMVPLNDALVAFVQSGAVDVREAWRKAADRTGLLKQLKREGIDTSFVERLA